MPPAAAPVALTRDVLLHHAQALPAAPQVLWGLCELLEDINTDIDQIAAQIRVDSALSARVLRISNSAVYGGGSPAASIDEAVSRVGFAEITRLVGIATVVGLTDRALKVYGITTTVLRESLLLHALASEALAERAGLDARAAYAGGLLRGVGLMVLDRVAQEKADTVAAFDPKAFPGYAAWEGGQFGLTSVEATTMILDEWRFPSELVAAMERHFVPRDDAMASVLHLAGAIVSSHRCALIGEAKIWAATPEMLFTLRMDEETYHEARIEAGKVFGRQRQALF
ncbi:MAG: HDOD domain-containing protein [Verrucomicrobiota bacterium]